MIKAYQSNGTSLKTESIQDLSLQNIWVNCIHPSQEELKECSEKTGALLKFLKAPLDMEEGSRIEVDENQMIMIIDVPVYEEDSEKQLFFDTIPLGIIILRDKIITVCLEDNSITSELESGKPKVVTFKRTRFLLQLLYKTSQIYIRYLRRIDAQTDELEAAMHKATHNKKLGKLLNLQKSITYFSTSLRANQSTVGKLRRSQFTNTTDHNIVESRKIIKMYEEDEDLLDDVETENRQAIEMAEIYGRILESMGNIFSSMISNNLNIVMRFLTSITLIVTIPTLIASILGMNVVFPFATNSEATFWFILLVTFFVTVLLIWMLRKKDLL